MAPSDWKVFRLGRRWTSKEYPYRQEMAPGKIEYVDGIFSSDRERRAVLGMLLELLGIDTAVQFGRLEDWKAAIAQREQGEAVNGIIPSDTDG